MCEPTTIVSLVSLGLAAAGGVAQHQAQSAAHKQSKEQSQYNSTLARESALGQYASLALRQTQEREAAAASIDDTARRAAEARATARASAGESGVAGASVDALLADYIRQEYDYQVRVSRNTGYQDQQFTREREGARLGLQSNLLNAQPIAKPNFLAQLPGIAGAGLGAFQSSYYDPVSRSYRFGSNNG